MCSSGARGFGVLELEEFGQQVCEEPILILLVLGGV